MGNIVFNDGNNNSNQEKVIAITVTYNRAHTLEKTIHALLNQTYPIDKIIVVDNNSNAKEKEVITKLSLLSSNIEIVWLDENLGGAGGFEAGMKRALKEYQPDWYWIMDDDAYPTPSCLKNLLSYKNELDNIGCLAPVAYGIDNKEYQMYHHKKVTKYIMKDNKVEDNYTDLKDITEINANAFVGPLFSKQAVEELGVADGGLFIYGDDTEYTYRVSRKFNIFLIKNAVIEHQDVPVSNNVLSPTFWWKEYYEIRNRFLFVKKFQKDIFKKLFAQSYLCGSLVKKIVLAIIKAEYKGYKKIRITILLKAGKDGLKGKKGKVIDPGKYLSMINEINKGR